MLNQRPFPNYTFIKKKTELHFFELNKKLIIPLLRKDTLFFKTALNPQKPGQSLLFFHECFQFCWVRLDFFSFENHSPEMSIEKF